MKPNVIIINRKDNVAVALEDIPEGSAVIFAGGEEFTASEKIPYSHKIALTEIKQGETVYKYGEAIGNASADIRKGAWVHTHNLTVEGGKA